MTSIIDALSALTVGIVEYVAPDEVRVLLELDAPQATALNTGLPSRFPRINGYVLIPNEGGALVGLVTWLGVERSAYPKRTGLKDFGLIDLPFPLRKMSLNPVGTLRVWVEDDGQHTMRLERGVTVFPSVGDPVQLPTGPQLHAIIEAVGEDARVRVGTSPLSANAAVSVDPNKLFGRHLAILGNTGSGKSCSVAGVIRWSLEEARAERERERRAGRPNARFIILDPNGEYGVAFRDLDGSVRRFEVPPSSGEADDLAVPTWMWNSHEWAAFAQAAPGAQRPLLLQGLRVLRAGGHADSGPEISLTRVLRGYLSILDATIANGPHAYTGWPGNKDCGSLLRNLAASAERYVSDMEDRDAVDALIGEATQLADAHAWQSKNTGNTGYNDFNEAELQTVRERISTALEGLPDQVDARVASEDAPLPFNAAELAELLEVLASSGDYGQAATFIGTLTMRIRMMLADQRLGPIVAPTSPPSFEEWLNDYVGEDQATGGEIAILNLSLVPADVLHIVVAVIARLIFEAAQRYRKINGEELPTVIVLEEAHSFVHRGLSEHAEGSQGQMCRETFERIAREGRKFGVGLVLSSQRPSELSPTVLAQCNTFLLHRIVNDRDQELVRRLVPDNLGALLRELPSLPSRHAILLGWATPVPVLVEMKHLALEHRPTSADPRFWEVWTGGLERRVDWKPIAEDWVGKLRADGTP